MRLALILIVLLIVPACQSAAQDGVVKRKIVTVQKQFEYNKIKAPDIIFETPLDIAQYYVGAYPMEIEGRPLVDVKIGRETETAPHLTMLITASGFEVGANYGEQWRIRIASIAEDKNWRIASAEHRFQCLRSDGIPDWSLTPCL